MYVPLGVLIWAVKLLNVYSPRGFGDCSILVVGITVYVTSSRSRVAIIATHNNRPVMYIKVGNAYLLCPFHFPGHGCATPQCKVDSIVYHLVYECILVACASVWVCTYVSRWVWAAVVDLNGCMAV